MRFFDFNSNPLSGMLTPSSRWGAVAHESGSDLFAQLMEWFPRYPFNQIVKRWGGNHRVRRFSCMDQFLVMAFAQLTGRESLRDIETCLQAFGRKHYHIGLRGAVARSTLADANERRPWQIWQELAVLLIERARRLYVGEDLELHLDNTLYALDSTTIDLCLACFRGPRFAAPRRPSRCTHCSICGEIFRLWSDHRRQIHDVNMLDAALPRPAPSTCRSRLPRLRAAPYAASGWSLLRDARQVELQVQARALSARGSSTGLICDQLVELTGFDSQQGYPERLRRIVYRDPERDKRLVFLTNHLPLPALTVCAALQEPLAGGVVLQMDQAAPSHQGFLRHFRERGQDPSLDCGLGLRAGGDRPQTPGTGGQSLHDSSGIRLDAFRENAHKTGPCGSQ